MNPSPDITLVNEHDVIVGYEEKWKVHHEGLLHRAFSVLLFDRNGRLLLQRRALEKYHSGGLWTNTCCGHPNEGETIEAAAHRRLGEEMGFDCPFEFRYKFQYKASFDNGLTEHEIDYIFVGTYEGEVQPNPAEVMEYRWVSYAEVYDDYRRNPEAYTYWFGLILDQQPQGFFDTPPLS
jgi:isopentenyl-diphosphate delta-isomerase